MQDYAIFRMGLDQEFVGGEIGSAGQFATATFPTADIEMEPAEGECGSALAPPSAVSGPCEDQRSGRQRAMCRRLRAGKEKPHFAALVGSAMYLFAQFT